ncbi:unnamed protein product, partial [Mesorhabditis spiculigera]
MALHRMTYWRTVGRGLGLGLLDVAIVISLGISIFYLFAGYAVRPYERGFYCNDTSIRGPFLHNTVTTRHLLLITLVAPVLGIGLFESLFYRNSNGANRLAKLYRSISLEYCEYLLAYTVCTIFMEFFKCYFGRLRPHFLSACDPDWSRMDCSTDPSAYIPQIYCKATEHRVRVSRTSFPSGHSSAASFVFFYFVVYTRRLSTALPTATSIRTARTILLPVLALWWMTVLVTRVTDSWHFPTDVIGGLALGAISIYIPFNLLQDPRPRRVFEKRQLDAPRPKNA